MYRRDLLLGLALLGGAAAAPAGQMPIYPGVRAGERLQFPRDHGAHPDFRSEWWYVTGWLATLDQRSLGFQVTFFRTRPAIDADNPSAFAPRQVLFAHAALSDPAVGRLLHAERILRAGFGLAEASSQDTDITLDDWRLVRATDGRFATQVTSPSFRFTLALTPTQPILLQGDGGYSRKGPAPAQASYYYSLPHLVVAGTLDQGSGAQPVSGEAWLDREWSSTLLPPGAVGWNWLGINLADGGALTLFQIRDKTGQAMWAGGSWRDLNQSVIPLGPAQVRFAGEAVWRSPRTLADYPVAPRVTITLPTGERHFEVRPLFEDQELDSRAGGGPVYWEGAVTLVEADRSVGRGYLELTGYVAPLTL
jgi:predicted secreted hydrolase